MGGAFVNYVQWQNRLLQAAHKSPEFRKEFHFDPLTGEIDPHLYEVAHVMGGSSKTQ
jgi:hypothetical protein